MNNTTNAEVESFIYTFEGQQRTLMLYLHNLLFSGFNLVAKMRYGIPFYYRKSWICYLNPTKKGIVELAFPRGNELSNEQGLLSDKGRKQVFSVAFDNVAAIPNEVINEIIQEAILLDEAIPYASKRQKK